MLRSWWRILPSRWHIRFAWGPSTVFGWHLTALRMTGIFEVRGLLECELALTS
jgi:hypothetical protein